ncbi:site-specific integrase [Aeromicrobium sp. Root472D3]|uniref:tyrosine-type recombinase/integrase n=1 Tax=Aeromicrobium sp. Root472D3 TaxID=1736540 RepID=UPI0006F891E2|nr:site-specific integrase [Aeromicrobium sp. Root472D3]KQX72382.1 integrase [Aeromicrobium sp. Root472D3]
MAGNIARRPNGKWRARYRDDTGQERTRHFDRKVDAQFWLDQITASVITGTYADPKAGQITFAAFYGEWSARQVWVPGTVYAMALAARTVPFSDKLMRQIRRSDVETWIKSMVVAGLAPGTIKTRYVNVRSVFRAAVKDHVIGIDPTDNVRLPRRRRADAAMTTPTPEDVGLLLVVADTQMRTFIALCAFAGLRLGEACGVQLHDVDFVRKQLKVTRQVQRAPGATVEVRAPKYGSERVVHLADGLIDLIAEHVSEVGTVGAEQWLFSQGDGPVHQNSVGYWWRKTLRAAGLSGIKLHDLRHFYASGLIAAGCDVVTVQRSLGHAKVTTTLDTYAHLWPTAEDRTRAAAQSIMAASLGDQFIAGDL